MYIEKYCIFFTTLTEGLCDNIIEILPGGCGGRAGELLKYFSFYTYLIAILVQIRWYCN